MTPALRSGVRALLVAAGVATTIAGLMAMRFDDWPVYVTYVVLTYLLFPFVVEVVPGLGLPMPGLALSLAFLYIGGLPIVALRNLALPAVTQLLRVTLPGRWWRRLPAWPLAAGSVGSLVLRLPQTDRMAVAAEWSMFAVGMGVRWAIASAVAGSEPPAGDLAAMAAAEVGGYACWGAFAALPILSFPPLTPPAGGEPMRPIQKDMGVVFLLLTPFVFLITYGYRMHGLAGAAGWSCASLGLHFVLVRLNERRMRVEEQHARLETLSRELAHRERLSAIGKTSSVLSHQILQQLGVIGIHADLVRHVEADGDPGAALERARTHAGAIEDALRGVDRVLRDLLVFSRDPRLNLYQHDVAVLVGECAAECRPFASERRVGLRVVAGAGRTATLDKLKVKQAVVNVLRNAVEATAPGGDVELDVASDGEIVITVADRGAGIAPGDRERVFVPFFTTKEHGTGLGLAIAREFVVAHGGAIAMRERPGGGTIVEIRLPRVAAA